VDVGGHGWGNRELQYYTARRANAGLDGHGHLAIVARRERFRGSDGVTRTYTSAHLRTLGRFSTMYGRIEARIKMPSGKGLHAAFWSMGTDVNAVGWPSSGEIDFVELLGSHPYTSVAHVHGPRASHVRGYGIGRTYTAPDPLTSGFHVYGANWRPDRIDFTIDNHRYGGVSRAQVPSGGSWVFDKPFFLILSLAVGGDWPGAPDSRTGFPARMLVDWVRVYR
jgi:beta-glucanase (GH16 family)